MSGDYSSRWFRHYLRQRLWIKRYLNDTSEDLPECFYEFIAVFRGVDVLVVSNHLEKLVELEAVVLGVVRELLDDGQEALVCDLLAEDADRVLDLNKGEDSILVRVVDHEQLLQVENLLCSQVPFWRSLKMMMVNQCCVL